MQGSLGHHAEGVMEFFKFWIDAYINLYALEIKPHSRHLS